MPQIQVYVSEDVTGVTFEEGLVTVVVLEPHEGASTITFTAKAAAKVADGIRAAIVVAADKAVAGA